MLAELPTSSNRGNILKKLKLLCFATQQSIRLHAQYKVLRFVRFTILENTNEPIRYQRYKYTMID